MTIFYNLLYRQKFILLVISNLRRRNGKKRTELRPKLLWNFVDTYFFRALGETVRTESHCSYDVLSHFYGSDHGDSHLLAVLDSKKIYHLQSDTEPDVLVVIKSIVKGPAHNALPIKPILGVKFFPDVVRPI